MSSKERQINDSILVQSKDVIFIGDKHGRLGIWEPLAVPDEVVDEDGEAVVTEGGRHWALQPHWPSTSKSSVSGVKLDPIDAHSVSYIRLLLSSSAKDLTVLDNHERLRLYHPANIFHFRSVA